MAFQVVQYHALGTGRGILDAADDPGFFARFTQHVEGDVGLFRGHADDHADAAVEHAVHLVFVDVALFLQPVEDAWAGPAGHVDYRLGAVWQYPRDVVEQAATVVTGIGAGCELAGCSLVGGETAEMPGMYEGEDYDLAGFCVGVVEKAEIIDGSKVATGDTLIALPSSGPHSNGYSLIRKIIEVSGADIETIQLDGKPLSELLMAPTRIYVKALLQLIKDTGAVKAMAHITGGGLLDNIPRVLPDGAQAVIDVASWTRPSIFDWLQEQGNVDEHEMHRVLNCGVGMIICVAPEQADVALDVLREAGEKPWIIGRIENAAAGAERVVLNNLKSH